MPCAGGGAAGAPARGQVHGQVQAQPLPGSGHWQEQPLLCLTAAVSPLLGSKQGWETCQTAAVTAGTAGLDALNPVLGDKPSADPVAPGRGLQLGLMPLQDHANSFPLAASNSGGCNSVLLLLKLSSVICQKEILCARKRAEVTNMEPSAMGAGSSAFPSVALMRGTCFPVH